MDGIGGIHGAYRLIPSVARDLSETFIQSGRRKRQVFPQYGRLLHHDRERAIKVRPSWSEPFR